MMKPQAEKSIQRKSLACFDGIEPDTEVKVAGRGGTIAGWLVYTFGLFRRIRLSA
jgi:hypothetical protein